LLKRCLISAGVLAILPATAGAATVVREGTVITYTAGSGEKSHLDVDYTSKGNVDFVERPDVMVGGLSPILITAGPGCTVPDPGSVRYAECGGAGATKVVVKLGDEKDELFTEHQPMAFDLPASIKFEADGGPGDDELIGTVRSDLLKGGAGDDRIWGSGGKDVESGGGGHDSLTGFGTLKGGAGGDSINLLYFSGGFKVFPSKAFGGSGNDSFLSGNKVRDTINCGSGKRDIVATGADKVKDSKKGCERHLP
jgi:Ca2+-binding RTX toxin-like protein